MLYSSRWLRGISLFLCFVLVFAMMSVGQFASAQGIQSDTQGFIDQFQSEIVYLNPERTKAEITFTKYGTPNDPVNMVVLMDASADNTAARNYTQLAFDSEIHHYMYDFGTNTPLKIVSYAEDVKSTALMETATDSENFMFEEMPGTANEVKGLEAAIEAVKELQEKYPDNSTVVVWVPSSKFNQSEADIEAKLIELTGLLGENDVFSTFQVATAVTPLLEKYATKYIPAHGSQEDERSAAYAGTFLKSRLCQTAESCLHDHYHNVEFDIALEEGQTLVKEITDVRWNTSSTVSNSITTTNNSDSVTVSMGAACRQSRISFTLTVELDPNVNAKQTVFAFKTIDVPHSDAGGGLHTGIFDNVPVTNLQIQLPEVVLNRSNSTITYDLNGGTAEEAISPVTAQAGMQVQVSDGFGLTKEGYEFGGWTYKDSSGRTNRLAPGELTGMFDEDTTLTAVWGTTDPYMSVDVVTEVEKTNLIAENPSGANGGQHIFDFTQVMIGGATVGDKVVSISFQDQALQGTLNADGTDPRKATITDAPQGVDLSKILYARYVGPIHEDGSISDTPVYAYLVESQTNAGKYDMIVAGDGGVTAPESAVKLFSNFKADGWQKSIERIAFNDCLDTSQVIDASRWFSYCSALKEISGIDTLFANAAPTTFYAMFYKCGALTSLNLSQWNVSQVTNIAYMFEGCSALKSVDVSWGSQTSNIQTANQVFTSCTVLSEITGISDWKLPNVTTLSYMFKECKGITSLDVSGWMPEKLQTISGFINYASNLESLELGNWSVPNLTSVSSFNVGTKLSEIDFSGWTNVNNLYYFYGFIQESNNENLSVVKLPQTKMPWSKLYFYVTLDLPYSYFYGSIPGNLDTVKYVDISGWTFDSNQNDYSNSAGAGLIGNAPPTGGNLFFKGDDIQITGTANLKDSQKGGSTLPWVSGYYGLSSQFISANNWNLNGTTQDLSNLLSNISATQTLQEFTGWTGLEGVTSLEKVFANASRLTTVSITNANMPALTTTANMFQGASKISSIDFTGWSGITSEAVIKGMFDNMSGVTPTLTVSNDEIGNWIKTEFLSKFPGGTVTYAGANQIETVTEAVSVDEPEATPEAPAQGTESEEDVAATEPEATPEVTEPGAESEETAESTEPEVTPEVTEPGAESAETEESTEPETTPEVTEPGTESEEVAESTGPEAAPEVTELGTESEKMAESTELEATLEAPVSAAELEKVAGPTEPDDEVPAENTSTSSQQDAGIVQSNVQRAALNIDENSIRAENGTELTIHPTKTPEGSIITVLTNIEYIGDLGARSGQVSFWIPMPQDISLADDPNITLGSFRYSETATGFTGGTVVEAPTVKEINGVKGIYGTVGDMYTGIEVPLSFDIVLGKKDFDVNSGYKIWYLTTYTQQQNIAKASNTLMFWDSTKDEPPSGEEHRLTYTYAGDVPPFSLAPLPEVEWHKLSDSVTLPEMKDVSYYIWKGWSYNGTLQGTTFTMPDEDAEIVGTWALDEEKAPKIAVSYAYETNNANGHVPDGAPVLPEEAVQVLIGRSYQVMHISQDVNYHLFENWVPTLQIGDTEYTATETDDNIYTIEVEYEGETYNYTIDLSDAGGALHTEQFRALADKLLSDGKQISIHFSGNWRPYTGTIFFNGAGATGGSMMPMYNVIYDDQRTLSANGFTKTGFKFGGWALDPGGTKIKADQDIASGLIKTDRAEVTLYALWVSEDDSGSTGGGGGAVSLYPVTIRSTGYGTASADKSTAAAGQTVTVTVSEGELISITAQDANGKTVELKEQGSGKYTLTMPAAAVTVSVKFAEGIADPDVTGVSDMLDTVNHKAYISGYPDGTFGPEGSITRAEVAAIFYRLLLDTNVEPAAFSDVESGTWYYDSVSTLAGLGILQGYKDGTFRPNNPITRAEFATIVTRFTKAVDIRYTTTFSDVNEDNWFYDAVNLAAHYGWIGGYGDGTFKPTNSINRTEAVKIVNGMLGRIADESAIDSGLGARFPDVVPSFWGYYHIIEAATTHTYSRPSNTSEESWENVS